MIFYHGGLFNTFGCGLNRDSKVWVADSYRAIIYFNKNDLLQTKKTCETFKQNEKYLNKKDFIHSICFVNYTLGGLYFLEDRFDEARYFKELAVSLDNSYLDVDDERFLGYMDL